MGDSLKQKTISGVLWSAVERFSVQIVQLIIQILIARILTPSDFGVVGMLTIFIAIAQTFVDSGFSNALIRKENRTETDNCTVFYFNIVVGLICYLILFFTAPIIAFFYDEPLLVPITRVVSLSVIFSSLSIVQRAILTIQVDFKKQAIASFVSMLISGCLGLYLAYAEFGPWALAVQTTLNSFITMILLWIVTRWVPKLIYSWKSFKEMFSFGAKLLVSGLLDTLYKNIYSLIIGKFYTTADLGYYTKSNTLAQLPAFNLTRIIQRVTYPIMCQISHENDKYRNVFITYLKITVFIIFPISFGLASIASPLVAVLLTEKWMPCVPLLQLLCINYVWHAVQALNLNILQVKGYSNVFLRVEIYKKIIGVLILLATIPFGVFTMCLGMVVNSIVGTVLDICYSARYLTITLWDEIKLIIPTIISSVTMWVVTYLVINSLNNSVVQLIMGTITALLTYLVMSLVIQKETFRILLNLVK